MASKDGYRMPPGWEDGVSPDVRPALRGVRPAMPATRRIEQVTVMFPVNSAEEFRWQFKDGSFSPWKPVPKRDLLKAPPGALGIAWRSKPVEKPAKPMF